MNASESRASLARLQNFWNQDRDNPVLTADLLDRFLNSGDIAQGRQFIDELSEEVMSFPKVAHGAGMLCLAASDYDYAEFCFRWAHTKAPGQAAVQYNLAYTLYCQERYREAIELLQQLGGDNAEALLLKARAQHHMGELAAAMDDLGAALNAGGPLPQVGGLLALVKNDAGIWQESIDQARETLREQPQQFEAVLAMADAHTALRKYAEAKSWCDLGLREYPEVGRFWTIKGQLELAEFDFSRARDSLRRAAELMPEHIGTWHLLGWCEVLLEDLAAAKEAFESALALNRNFAESHGGLAVVDALLGNWAAAEESSKRALGLERNNLSGRYAQALCLEHGGKAGAAEDLRQQLFATPTGKKVETILPEMIQKFMAIRGGR